MQIRNNKINIRVSLILAAGLVCYGFSFSQKIKSSGGFLASSTSYTVPENEYWKVLGGFGNEGPSAPMDSAALVAKYSGIYSVENIHAKKHSGGMLMREMMPTWIAPGSKFSLDPNDLLEVYIEKYAIITEANTNEK